MPAAIPIAGAVAGSLVSGAMNKSSGGSQSVDKSPWEPAQGALKNQIKDGESLYGYYQQNPFSDAQKTAYQNQFTMNDLYNNQIMPAIGKGLGGLLGSNYGDIGAILSGGLAGRNQGLLNSAPQSAQSAQYARPSFSLLDFAAMNPWGNSITPAAIQSAQAAANTTPATAEEERRRLEEEYLRNSGNFGAGFGGGE